MHLRAAILNDGSEITELVNAAYSGPEAEMGWTPETHLHAGPRTTLGHVNGYLASKDKLIIVAEFANRIMGCALLEFDGSQCKFGMFAVHPKSQSSGIGKRIIEEAENQAVRRSKCDRLCLTAINLQVALISYYERRGFLRTGETIPFPHDEEPGATRFDYHLVALEKRLVR